MYHRPGSEGTPARGNPSPSDRTAAVTDGAQGAPCPPPDRAAAAEGVRRLIADALAAGEGPDSLLWRALWANKDAGDALDVHELGALVLGMPSPADIKLHAPPSPPGPRPPPAPFASWEDYWRRFTEESRDPSLADGIDLDDEPEPVRRKGGR
jgi:hypothetical protein